MSTKSRLLNILTQHSGALCSGEELARTLGVSRTAVWKAISALREDGYDIEASTRLGYTLRGGDAFTNDSLRRELEHFCTPQQLNMLRVDVREQVGSTITELKALADAGEGEGYLLAAHSQTAGRGRMGRSFFSQGTGVYMSLLLRPKLDAQRSLCMTAAAAVAVTDAIAQVCGIECGIKWVNDIFLDGKKICGILTEASLDMESGGLRDAVVGIGINVTPPPGGYPPPLDSVATALYPSPDAAPPHIRARLCAAVTAAFLGYYTDIENMSFMDAYRARSIVIGRRVYAVSPTKSELVEVLDITDDASLLVRRADNTTTILTSGEISLRGCEEYEGGLLKKTPPPQNFD